jgi:hypothetical protein
MGRNFNRYCWRHIKGPMTVGDADFFIARLMVGTTAD